MEKGRRNLLATAAVYIFISYICSVNATAAVSEGRENNDVKEIAYDYNLS